MITEETQINRRACPQCGRRLFRGRIICHRCGWRQNVLGYQGDTDQEFLILEKVENGLTMAQIARDLGVSRQRIDQRFKKMDISEYYRDLIKKKRKERSRVKPPKTYLKCAQCHRRVIKRSRWVYCSEKCYKKACAKKTKIFMKYYRTDTYRGVLYGKAYRLLKKSEPKLDKP